MSRTGRRTLQGLLVTVVLLLVLTLWQQPRFLLELTQSLIALCT